MIPNTTALQSKTSLQTLANPIVIKPSSAKYAEKMIDLMCVTYGYGREDSYSAEQFAAQARIFPEGQFIAVDTRTDEVVGLTLSMRVAFDPKQPLLESWVETTNYG
jgi:hypothetical protein